MCMNMSKCVCMRVMSVCMWVQFMRVCMWVQFMRVCMCVHVYMYVYVYMYTASITSKLNCYTQVKLDIYVIIMHACGHSLYNP
jgi:hypothetical protein